MKNVFKMFGLMLLASATMLVACDPENNTNNNGNNNNGEEPTVPTYTITVNCNDATMGSVAKTPDSAAYHAGTQVTLTATPNTGHKFINWTGAETSTENPYTITVGESNATYTATFEAIPQASWNATFDGAALDIAGWGDGIYAPQENFDLWLIQFAKQAEGTQVWFPYIVMWMGSTSQANFQVLTSRSNPLELYKDTYYTAGDANYGDWQYYATNSLNCTAMDMTDMMISFTGSFSMYWLTEIVNETHNTPEECTKKDLNITCNNLVCEMASSKNPLRKMNVK